MSPDTRTGRRGNRPLEARMPAWKRQLFMELAHRQGTTAADWVNQFVDYMIGEPGAELPTRPEIVRDDLAVTNRKPG